MPGPNVTYCEQLIQDGVVGKGEADIAGPGVITAFLISGLGTMFAILVAYVFGLVDGGLLRAVDRQVLRVSSRVERYPRIHVALRKAIITMSDQQMITGIAVLAAGFQGLRTGNMSVYHYQTVIYLGWLSSSVHLSALTLLRPFLWHHRGMMWWRVIGMLVLLVMLLIALVPTLSNDWAVVGLPDEKIVWDDDRNAWRPVPQNGFGVPAICYWGQLYGSDVNPDAILSYVILLFSYLWKMGGLFMPVRNGWQNYFRAPLETLLEKPLLRLAKRYRRRQGGTLALWAFRTYIAFWLPFIAVLEIMGSFSAAIWLSVLGTIYGAIQILIPRQLVQQFDPSIADQENEFGFGQLIALILLVQPLGAVAEHIWLVGKDDERIYGDMDHPDHKTDSILLSTGGELTTGQQPVLTLLSNFSGPVWFRETSARVQLRARLYQSKLFAALVWWTQVGIAIVAVFIFWIDAIAIGWQQTVNVQIILLAIGGFAALTFTLMLTLLPFSRLVKPYDVATELSIPTHPGITGSGHGPALSRNVTESSQGLELKEINKLDHSVSEVTTPHSMQNPFSEDHNRRRSKQREREW